MAERSWRWGDGIFRGLGLQPLGRRALFSDLHALTIAWILANHYRRQTMTLKQQVHLLIDELPDDSPLLIEVREALRMDHAIGEAMADARAGRTYSAEAFMAKVRERWPRGGSE
jgi:hypothetical protein